MALAPIALFTYNRPDQTLKTITALAANILANESVIYVFCDGPKKGADEKELERINNVRSIAENIKGFKEVIVVKQPENRGLANSIIGGVTDVINTHGNIIVLEDDIFTSVYFLQFMNDALNVYQHVDKLMGVSACNYFAEGDKYPSTFFLPVPDCLGWATWKDRWQHFEKDSQKLLIELKNKRLEDSFNLFGAYDFINMLENQIKGKVDSWAVRWQAVCYLQNKLSVYPNPSITQHMHSTTSTHAAAMNIEPALATERIKVEFNTPKLDSNSFKAMLKGYTYLLVKNRYRFLIEKIKVYKVFFLRNKQISKYVKSHDTN